MILVIAEKPSVAQSIAKVLGATSRKDGYMEGGNYIVSWCFGHLVELADASAYVGIAEDEPKRLARLDGVKKVSLLAKYGMTEVDAYKLCQEHGLLSPIYTHCRRNGCWFCPNASDEELLHMITKHPELFDRLIEWEKEDNIFHRRLTRRETPSEVKARLLSKSQTGFSSPRSKYEMEV